MLTDQPLPDSAPAISVFLQELQSISGHSMSSGNQSLSGWMKVADTSAIEVQHSLEQIKIMALRVTLAAIAGLAVLAVVLRTPAPQVLCPFAVFLMILFSDWQRKQADVFRFTALRLTAETLRIIQAVQYMPDQLAMVLSSRRLGTHAVVSLAEKACEASRVRLAEKQAQQIENSGSDFWSAWTGEQGAYYSSAFAREKRRAKRARGVFNVAFGFVGVAGITAAIWGLSNPDQVGTDAFRILMATASAAGSCGLAYMSYVRDKKVFEQSLDYGHMCRVFHHDRPDFKSITVNESMTEHARWALRMAGHFEFSPQIKALT